MFSENFTLVAGPIGVDGSILLDGHVLARGSGFFTKGHVFTELADRGMDRVGPCPAICRGILDGIVVIVKLLITTILPFIGNLTHYFYLTLVWCDIKCDVGFSFRVDDDYKIKSFLIYEDRWQQMARLGGKNMEKWEEKPVKPSSSCGEPTWPFPGKKWFTDKPALIEQDFQIVQKQGDGLIDKQRGTAPSLDSVYKNPEFKKSPPKLLNSNYLIVPRK